jgi:hypothetical protein
LHGQADIEHLGFDARGPVAAKPPSLFVLQQEMHEYMNMAESAHQQSRDKLVHGGKLASPLRQPISTQGIVRRSC